MISFESDYNNGAHPKVLQRLIETNEEQTLSYGFDVYCDSAKAKIKAACEDPEAEIFFLSGGTQTNATVIDSVLHTYEGVVSVETGHINTHEAGAIEFTEHKVISVKETNGKMDATVLNDYLYNFLHDGNASHSVYPGMVYITFPTEYGTLYSAKELDDIHQVCRSYDLPLYVDGARLGYGLMSEDNDITLPYLAHHCDMFYIGGTKVGALCGEAIVFTHNNAHKHFFNIQKQHGALMAKGRLLGVQFDALFTDDLYFHISRHAIHMAMRMKAMFQAKGYRFFIDSPTNQQFVIMSHAKVEELNKKDILFTHWGPLDKENMICRFVTSWATKAEDLDYLEQNL